MNYKNKWEFAIEAYSGDGGFDDGSYLDKHTRESDEKFEERKKITDYSNIFVQKVGRYVGYLYKQQPIRATNNEAVKLIFEDANNAGDSIDVFMSGFAKTAKVRGVGVILVDMVKQEEIPTNKGDQLAQRALPYFVDIAPEDLVKYKMDKFGKFEFVAFKDILDESTYEEEKKKNIIRYYDETEWKVFDENSDILDSGTHGLGICPVLAMGENGAFPDVGEFTQVANIAKRHFNLESEMDDIMRGQTFSILTIQADNPSDVAITLSTDNAIKYGAGMQRPDFIAPDVSPSETYEKKIDKLESRINEITYDVTTGLQSESGIALDIKFQGLNGSLGNFAMRLQDLEIRMFDVVKKYLGDENIEIRIAYPENFNIIDLDKEIKTLDSVKRMGFDIPIYEATKLKQIIGNDLNGVDADTMAQINAEIEDGLKEQE